LATRAALETDVRITDMNWMQVEECLRHDDRAVLPLGSTEQHSHLRLTVDCILPERVAADAAEPLGVPVFPVVPYGVTPYFREFPGSISLKVETHLRVVGDILDGLAHSGFRRILIVNGHGGNNAVQQFALEWTASHPACRVLPGVTMPDTQSPMVDLARVRALDPVALRAYLGDGNFGGRYQAPSLSGRLPHARLRFPLPAQCAVRDGASASISCRRWRRLRSRVSAICFCS
jgi:creatinine amidohydrolase